MGKIWRHFSVYFLAVDFFSNRFDDFNTTKTQTILKKNYMFSSCNAIFDEHEDVIKKNWNPFPKNEEKYLPCSAWLFENISFEIFMHVLHTASALAKKYALQNNLCYPVLTDSGEAKLRENAIRRLKTLFICKYLRWKLNGSM